MIKIVLVINVNKITHRSFLFRPGNMNRIRLYKCTGSDSPSPNNIDTLNFVKNPSNKLEINSVLSNSDWANVLNGVNKKDIA